MVLEVGTAGELRIPPALPCKALWDLFRLHCLGITDEARESYARAYDKRHGYKPRDRLSELRAMPYADYLTTPEWAETRQDVLDRAAFKCQLCGRNGGLLHVHHNSYEHLGEEYPEDMIALCAGCHTHYHEVPV